MQNEKLCKWCFVMQGQMRGGIVPVESNYSCGEMKNKLMK